MVSKFGMRQPLYHQGSVLAEAIIALALVAVMGALVVELASTSNRLGGSSTERLTSLRLAEEGLEVMRAIAQGNNGDSQGWNRIYRPPDGMGNAVSDKGATHPYRLAQSAGIWILAPGEEIVSLNGKSYARKIVIENVSRNGSSDIESTYSLVNDDPATQKITVTVAASSTSPVVLVYYMTRYLNEGSRQTNWQGGINAGPFAATTSVSSVSSSASVDIGGSGCGAGGPCIRLQTQ